MADYNTTIWTADYNHLNAWLQPFERQHLASTIQIPNQNRSNTYSS